LDVPDTDPFDRIYAYGARHAIDARDDPPSRERWDAIVLRLILSEDPDRIARYRNLEAIGPATLGEDAYELWLKMPTYMPNRSVPAANWAGYEAEQRGSMRRLMEAEGLLDKYSVIAEAQQRAYMEQQAARKARAKSAQRSVLIIGCAGMTFIVFMMLTVLLIIAIKFL
jgi:hypothetical protein